MNPSIIQVDSFKCRADVPLSGLLIVGAALTSYSVELWHPSLPQCFLPDYPRGISYLTLNSINGTIISCYWTTCEVFQSGVFVHFANTMVYRVRSSSVVSSEGLLLLGGTSTNTTEVITPTGEARPGQFTIRHGDKVDDRHCTMV